MLISVTRRAGALPIALACAGVFVLSACGSGGRTVGAVPGSAPASGIKPPAASTGKLPPDSSAGEPAPATPAKPSRVLPNLIGKGLQVAQDSAQAAGFDKMTSHDASGRKRVQILDRDWKVCFQSPSPGSHAVSTKVDFGTVKLQERCPGKDKGNATAKARQIMPDLRGKSAAAAFAFLGLDANITWRDGTGADRSILLPTNWKVCAQTPKPGAKYNGVPVTLTVVKVSENC